MLTKPSSSANPNARVEVKPNQGVVVMGLDAASAARLQAFLRGATHQPGDQFYVIPLDRSQLEFIKTFSLEV
jgi:hypothetical protein